jgi:hypothetical protein
VPGADPVFGPAFGLVVHDSRKRGNATSCRDGSAGSSEDIGEEWARL